MHNDTQLPWSQFELRMRMGVPHAVEIASELVRHNLTVPLHALHLNEAIDLQFYGIVHEAYRANVLPTFLSVMECLKHTEHWEQIHIAQHLQMQIVNLCRILAKSDPKEIVVRFREGNFDPTKYSDRAA